MAAFFQRLAIALSCFYCPISENCGAAQLWRWRHERFSAQSCVFAPSGILLSRYHTQRRGLA